MLKLCDTAAPDVPRTHRRQHVSMPERFSARRQRRRRQETREWLDALSAVIAPRAASAPTLLLEELINHARQAGIDLPFSATTATSTPFLPTRKKQPGQHRDRRAPAHLHALERDGDGG
jgi:hypothetical protein